MSAKNARDKPAQCLPPATSLILLLVVISPATVTTVGVRFTVAAIVTTTVASSFATAIATRAFLFTTAIAAAIT